MSTDDPFSGDSDKTILRPKPGGGRRRESVVAASGQAAPHAEPRTQIFAPGTGPNSLVAAANSLFVLSRQLANTVSHPNIQALRDEVSQELHRFEQAALRQGIDQGTVITAR